MLIEGWARRQDTNSIAWHYFRAGYSLCVRHWDAPNSQLESQAGGLKCPECQRLVQRWELNPFDKDKIIPNI
jgi:hypothetical protein